MLEAFGNPISSGMKLPDLYHFKKYKAAALAALRFSSSVILLRPITQF